MSSRRKKEDRVSCLPHEVLSHILSLMPTRFAVRTSILSKRWKYSWTLVTNLDFDDDHPTYGLDYFSKFVDRVLEHCKTPQLKLFRLGISRLSVQKSDVSKWIDKAIRLKVCELVCPPELPLSLFTSKTLTILLIYGSSFDLDFFDVASPVIMLPALKTLYLRDCKPSRKVFKFIHGCPVLESLSLLFWPDNEEDYYFDIPTLKRLGLEILSYSFVSKFVLNVPNLEYLHVSGMLCSLFVIEDLSSLVKATVSFCLSTEKFNHLNTELLKVISGAKSISWSAPSLDLKDFLHSPLPKFPNLKRLELKGPFQSPWFLVVQILESTSELEHFCFEEPEGSCWIEPQSVPNCMLSNLITMKITKCKGRECDLQFLEYILGNAEVLKTLTIICGSLRMKDEMKMCSRLLKFPRASRYCEIHFVGKWLNSIGN